MPIAQAAAPALQLVLSPSTLTLRGLLAPAFLSGRSVDRLLTAPASCTS